MGTRVNISLNDTFPTLFQNIHGGEAFYDPLDKDQDQPTILWMENILPTVEGICSAIRSSYITATISGGTVQQDYSRVYVVYDENEEATLYTYTADKHWVYDIANNTWDDLGTAGTSADPATISYVEGRSYIHKTGLGVYKFDAGFTSITEEPILGIVASEMNGMISALNYAIAWDDNTIYWSAPAALGNFEPLTDAEIPIPTGAGSSRLRPLKGKIVTVYPISGGFIVYGDRNMVSARYSGNSVNPWIFKEIVNSAGIIRPDAVNADNTSDVHFVWTVEGLKIVQLEKAEATFPELSEFLFGYSYFSSDNDGTFTLNTSTYTDANSASQKAPLAVKVSYIANRFVCISYGGFSGSYFEFILVFDRVLQRWGHLKVSHVDVFNFVDVKNLDQGSLLSNFVGELGQGSIAVMRAGGRIDVYKDLTDSTMPTGAVTTAGEVVFGGIRLTRQEQIQLSKIIVHGYKSATTVSTLTSDDEGERSAEVTWLNTGDNSKDYFGDTTGRTHRIRLSGSFNLSAIEVDLTRRGKYS